MNFIDIKQHYSCYNYDHTDHPMIDKWTVPAGKVTETVSRYDTVAFILRGEVDFNFQDYPKTRIREGNFVFIPIRARVRYKCITDTEMLLVRMYDHVRLCESYSIKQLYDETGRSHRLTIKSHCILDANPAIRNFAASLEPFINGAFRCRYYHSLKVKEFFVLLRMFYTREQLRDFFHLILSIDTAFVELVHIHHTGCRSAKELANTLNYSQSGFRRKFNEVFGEPVYAWMTRQKAEVVYREICENKKGFKQIAEDNGFKSQSKLSDFCRSVFDKTPGQIRKTPLKDQD